MSGELCILSFLDADLLQLHCVDCTVEGRDLYFCFWFFWFFPMSRLHTQRGPGSHADEPVLGRELESGNGHTHTHATTAISVFC